MARSQQRLRLNPSTSAWVRAAWRPDRPQLPAEVFVYVRFARRPKGWWEIVELRINDPDQRVLHALPLGRIEQAANASAAITGWLDRYHESDLGQDVHAWFSNQLAIPSEPVHDKPAARARLRRPAGRRLSDDFYKQVATAYRSAVAAGLNPRKTLAEDAHTPADTVARWIAESRRRHHLPKGEPGKVTVDPGTTSDQ